MRCPVLICGQNVIVDKQNNRSSIINILDDLVSPIYPIVIPIAMYAKIVKEESEVEYTEGKLVLMIKLNENILLRHEFLVYFGNGPLHTNAVFNIEGIMVSQPGDLSISLNQRTAEKETELSVYRVSLRNFANPAHSVSIGKE